ncbi:MAG: hypothetical protein MHMPM18_002198 [Marteilia pararefringens]
MILKLLMIFSFLFLVELGEESKSMLENHRWIKLNEQCYNKIPVDIRLKNNNKKKQQIEDLQPQIIVEYRENDESKLSTQCRRFYKDFLRKANLLRSTTNGREDGDDDLGPSDFQRCRSQCFAHYKYNDDDYVNKMKHLADFCRFDKIIKVPQSELENMTFEQFLERKVDLRSELSTVEEINDSMEAPQVLDLDSYIDVIVSKEKRLDIKDACHELYRQIDISHKYQHLMQNNSNGYYFPSNEAKSDKKRKYVVPIIICGLVGALLLIGVLGYLIYRSVMGNY